MREMKKNGFPRVKQTLVVALNYKQLYTGSGLRRGKIKGKGLVGYAGNDLLSPILRKHASLLARTFSETV
jgi:hypothetical protein